MYCYTPALNISHGETTAYSIYNHITFFLFELNSMLESLSTACDHYHDNVSLHGYCMLVSLLSLIIR